MGFGGSGTMMDAPSNVVEDSGDEKDHVIVQNLCMVVNFVRDVQWKLIKKLVKKIHAQVSVIN